MRLLGVLLWHVSFIFDLRLGCIRLLHGLVRHLDSHLVAWSSARTSFMEVVRRGRVGDVGEEDPGT